jgi:hypothetical protein
MPERVKLQEPGSELVMTVNRVTPETVDNVEYFLFTNGNKELLVPATSVKSQVERLGVSSAFGIAGSTVKFSRSTKLSKFGKPFWNLDLAEAPKTNGNPPVSASNVPNKDLPPLLQNQEAEDAAELQAKIGTVEKPKLTQLYLDATTFVLDRIVPKFEEKEIGLSDTAVVAAIATLFIAASKER